MLIFLLYGWHFISTGNTQFLFFSKSLHSRVVVWWCGDGLFAKSCPTLFNPMDWSPPDSCVRGILQARILEWVAISYSRGSSQSRGQIYLHRLLQANSLLLSHQGNPRTLVPHVNTCSNVNRSLSRWSKAKCIRDCKTA